jgi:hypothetical protein
MPAVDNGQNETPSISYTNTIIPAVSDAQSPLHNKWMRALRSSAGRQWGELLAASGEN